MVTDQVTTTTTEAGAATGAATTAAETTKPATVLGAGGGNGFDWKGALGDDYAAHESTIAGKGWKGPGDAVKAYAEAQKLIGKGLQGGLQPPKDDAPPEEWGKFYDALGRPKAPTEYELPIPQGESDDLAKAMAPKLHEAGLTKRQAKVVAEAWNEIAPKVQAAREAAEEAEFAKKSAADLAVLEKEWGPEYAANIEFSKRALRAAGMTEDEGAALERALGLGKAVRLMAAMGRNVAEDRATGDRHGGSFGLTADQAKAKLEANKANPTFRKALLDQYDPGHKQAVEEQDRLRRISMGEKAA